MTTRVSRIGARLRDSWQRGRARGVASDITSYLAWKTAGAPARGNESTDEIEERLARLEGATAILLARDWYRAATPRTSPLVSIILPTRDRPDLLRRAVESVTAQSYRNLELVMVDDSEQPTKPGWLDQAGGEMSHWIASGAVGVGAARNAGLEHAQGEIILFLDDDNVMDPDWAKSTVIAMEDDPDAEVVVGAQLVFPESGDSRSPQIRFPSAFEWDTLIRYNYVDLGTVAHRVIDDLRFDETLPAFLDWDYVVRLTMDRPPLLIPVLSGLYFTDAPGRVSYGERRALQLELQTRFATLRPDLASKGWQASVGISETDLAAIRAMLARLDRKSVQVVEVGTPRASVALSGRVVDSIGWSTTEVGALPTDRRYDIAILEKPATLTPLQLIKPDGLVIGLDAHRNDYASAYPQLPHQRRLGDALWVGSNEPVNFTELFPGSALTKLGYDSPATGAETNTNPLSPRG